MPIYRDSTHKFFRWTLPGVLHADEIEVISTTLEVQGYRGLILDLSEIKHCSFGAEGRLLNLLVGLRRQNKRAISYIQDKPDTHEFLYRTLAGLILTRLTEDIIDQFDNSHKSVIRQNQTLFLSENSGLIHENVDTDEGMNYIHLCAPAVDELGTLPISHLCTTLTALDFSSEFRFLFSKKANLNITNAGALESVIQFAREAFQNTKDHCMHELDKKTPLHGIRFINIRNFELDFSHLDALLESRKGRANFAFSDPITYYLDGVHERLTKDRSPQIEGSRLVEISISDSGYGIPEKMSRAAGCTVSSPDEELEWLTRALRAGGTSKDDSVNGAGLGLYRMMEAAYSLKGLVLLRTGRINMYRHYLDHDVDWPTIQQCEAGSVDALQFRLWSSGSISPIGGTTITLVFPWYNTHPLVKRVGKLHRRPPQRQLALTF